MQRHHVEVILQIASEVPVVNQLEYHPYFQRANNFIPWMRSRGIEVSSFKGLAPITVAQGAPLDKPLQSIAQAHGVTCAAVLLKWAMNQGVIPITTTSKEDRMEEYLSALNLNLSAEEQQQITEVGLTHGEIFF